MRPGYLTFGAPKIEEAAIAEVVDSLRSGWLGTGPKVAIFENIVRDYVGSRYAVAVNSCTAALHLSLLASGVGPGDEVITTPMTFAATANAIVHTGAKPVFVDCERATQLIDPDRIRAAVTTRTRAIIPVHMTGRPCAMDEITAVADQYGLAVIEDAAHALEARYHGRKVGSISPLTCFSFYVTKNVTTGEGGIVATDDAELAGRVKMYALHGMSRDAWKRYSDEGFCHYEVVVPGFKYNMMDLQAAIGIHQMCHVDVWLERRRAIWEDYDRAFADLPILCPPAPERDTVHARHLYTLMIDEQTCGVSRNALMARLHTRGIGSGVHYVAVHLHPWYRKTFGLCPTDFPNAAWISERTMSIPCSPHLEDTDVARVIAAVYESIVT